jgi:SAM-dependent methyltransferase
MIWIVGGATAAGKTHFIGSPRRAELTGLGPDAPVLRPRILDKLAEVGDADCLFHYNILRPLDLQLEAEGRAPGAGPLPAPDFGSDPAWKELAARKGEKRAVVIVASREVLLRRIRPRRAYEPDESAETYPAARWLQLVRAADLAACYEAWCAELRRAGIPYVLVDGRTDRYPELASDAEIRSIVEAPASPFTKGEIERILLDEEFPYHRVDLPYGLYTAGEDRRSTWDLVFPESLAGKTVLDVGSALGAFCFEAEERDAARVVGVELNPARYEKALRLKQIKASEVEFLLRDFAADPVTEPFDYVLALNLIHHLKEPVRALRQLASITRGCLVIEFPTFRDEKFRAVTKLPFLVDRLLERLPLVGVSSLPRADQTFVFTGPALRRILTDHEPLFRSVRIRRSPFRGRSLAICER